LLHKLPTFFQDAVDIINLSLGSNYQQPYDDLISQSADAASALGVLIVASAGNGGDKPFITGSPASAQSVLSVAQTQVPSASLQIIAVAGGERIPAVIQPWSKELENIITGSIQYGDGSGGNLDGCAPFAEGSLAGKIVLVDRGVCSFTLKIR
jgi:subtilisin family serine protease